MPRTVNLFETLELTDEEFLTLLDVLSDMPVYTLLASSYISIKYKENINILTADHFRSMAELARDYDEKDKRFTLIRKLLQFRARASITI